MAVYIPVPSLDRGECERAARSGEKFFTKMSDACLHSESGYILKVMVYDHEHTGEKSIKQYYGEWETEIRAARVLNTYSEKWDTYRSYETSGLASLTKSYPFTS